MPQLDPSSFASQLFWLTISFLLLYVLVVRWMLPRIHGLLQQRENRISSSLSEAERLQKEAEDLEAHYHKQLADVRKKATSTITKAKQDVQQKLDQQHADLQKKMQQKIHKAEQGLAKAQEEAQQKIEDATATLAADAAKQIAGLRIDAKTAKKCTKEFLHDAPNKR